MKKINSPLLIAGIVLIIILTVILFPKLFTNKSPYNLNKLIFSHEDGEFVVEAAPFAPSKEFIFGTDDVGRDIYTYIIYGTRLTILLGLLVAFVRFVIALPIAFSAGFGNKAAKAVIKVFSVIFSAIPAVLVSLIILKMDFFVQLERSDSIIAFVLVLSFVGWPKISRLIMERVEAVNSQPYVKSEVAIGKNRFKIALQNIIPHLAPELIVLQFMEVARALAIIMTLGIFNVFIGNLKFILDSAWGRLSFYKISFEPEWASMLSSSRSMIESAPWSVLFPAFAFFVSIIAFNLFGEGLRNAMQKSDSRVIPMTRKLISFDFINLWKRSKRSSKIKLGVTIILITAIICVPYLVNINEYDFQESDKNEIPYEEVIIGTDEAQETAKIITDRMLELGISPMENDSFYIEYDIEPSVILAEHSVMFGEEGTSLSAQLNEDYAFLSAGSYEYSGIMYDTTKEDLFNIEDYSKFSNKFILIDKEYYEDSAVEFFIDDIRKHVEIKGVMLIAGYEEEVSNIFIEEDSIFTLLLSKEFAGRIKDSGNISVEISAQIEPIGPEGRNILGIFGEYDPEAEEKAFLIGMNYNYANEEGAQVLKFNLDLVEKLCKTYDNQRAIMFLFVDGTLKEEYNGLYNIIETLPYSSYKVDVFIDLTRLNEPYFDEMEFSSVLAPFTRQFAWSISSQLEKNFTKRGIEFDELEKTLIETEYYLTQSDALNLMFWKRGIATVVVGSGEPGEKRVSVYDIGSILIKVINENSY